MRPLLALFLRSLREDARGRGTYLLRTAMVLLILFWMWITHQTTRWTGAPGRQFFLSVLWIDLLVGSVAGLSYFSSAVSEEKEDGTLGLLRMADLNALAILLGKSTGRLIGALFVLLSQIPFALLAVTMGGLNVGQVLAGYVCLLSFTFLLGNLGLLASVLCRTTARATMVAILALGVFLFTPAVARGVSALLAQFNRQVLTLRQYDFFDAWRDALPGPRVNTVLATGFSGGLWSTQATVCVALGVLCFVAAWLAFEPAARRASDPDAALAPSRSRLRRSGRAGGSSPAAAVRWKQFRLLGDWRALVLRTGLVLGGGGALFTLHRFMTSNWEWEDLSYICLFGSGGAFLVFTTADASRIFGFERQQQTLASLLLLPIPTWRIVFEKALGSFATTWPLLALAAIGAALQVREISPHEWAGMMERPSETFMGACGMAYAALAFTLLPVFVAWMSLRIRRGAAAVGLTVWLIGGWMLSILVMIIMHQAGLIVMPVLCTVMLGYFLTDIPRRLEALAAEE